MYRVAKYGLAPLLLAQGRHVRRVTPRLPEATGPRAGEAGAGPTLRLLIVGDSAAAGVGVAAQPEALGGRLVASLATDFRVRWRLVAKTGYTTQDLLDRLQTEPAQPFDMAVTSIGVNDVTGDTPLRHWLDVYGHLADVLESRFGAMHLLLSSVPPIHLFPALPQPLRWYLGRKAQAFNRALRSWAQSRANCESVATNFLPGPGVIAADGFHPGAAAYSLWAAQLACAIRGRWAPCYVWRQSADEGIVPTRATTRMRCHTPGPKPPYGR